MPALVLSSAQVTPSSLLTGYYLDNPRPDTNLHIAPLGCFSYPLRLGELKGNSFQVVLRNLRRSSSPCGLDTRVSGALQSSLLHKAKACSTATRVLSSPSAGQLPLEVSRSSCPVPSFSCDSPTPCSPPASLASSPALGGVQFLPVRLCAENVRALAAQVEAGVRGVSSRGFLNYFGLQRFGTHSVRTFEVGAALLRADWKAAVALILGEQAQARTSEGQAVEEKSLCPLSPSAERGASSVVNPEAQETEQLQRGVASAERKQSQSGFRDHLSDEAKSPWSGLRQGALLREEAQNTLNFETGDAAGSPPACAALSGEGQQEGNGERDESLWEVLWRTGDAQAVLRRLARHQHIERTLLSSLWRAQRLRKKLLDKGRQGHETGEEREVHGTNGEEVTREVPSREETNGIEDRQVRNGSAGAPGGRGPHPSTEESEKDARADSVCFTSGDYLRALQELPRNSLQLYLHAAQSVLFNHVCSWRWRVSGDKVQVGDLVRRVKSQHREFAGEKLQRQEARDTASALPGAQLQEEDDGPSKSGAVVSENWMSDSLSDEEDDNTSGMDVGIIESPAEAERASIFDVVLPLPGSRVIYPPGLRDVYDTLSRRLLGVPLTAFSQVRKSSSDRRPRSSQEADGLASQDKSHRSQQNSRQNRKERNRGRNAGRGRWSSAEEGSRGRGAGADSPNHSSIASSVGTKPGSVFSNLHSAGTDASCAGVLGLECKGSYRPLLERARKCQWQLVRVSVEADAPAVSILRSDVDLLLAKEKQVLPSAELEKELQNQGRVGGLLSACPGELPDAGSQCADRDKPVSLIQPSSAFPDGQADWRVSWDDTLDSTLLRSLCGGSVSSENVLVSSGNSTERSDNAGKAATAGQDLLAVAGSRSNFCLLLRLWLPPGTYFTMALREIMKTNAPDDDEFIHGGAARACNHVVSWRDSSSD